MSRHKFHPHRWQIVVTALAAGILLPLFAFTTHAQAADGKAYAQAVAPVSIEQDATGVTDDGGGGDHDGKDGPEVRGLVEQLPDGGLIGTWVISGTNYTVTADTEINEKYGTVEIGACVKLELKSDKSTVREAKTAPEYVCDKGDDNGGGDGNSQGHGELYARLVSFPPDLVGQWVIGTLTFTATEQTEFKQENGAFTVGEFVKVEFSVQPDGSFLAREIKTAIKPGPGDDGGDDDDDHHPHHGGKAFGKIEVLPDGGTTGIWQIAGVTYTVNVSTELKNRGEAFAVGQTVKVEYKLDADGNRLAREIKRMPPKAGGPQDGVFKLVGTVQALPSDGFIGDWTIAGVDAVADANTKFEEEHGILQVDAFVEATYVMSGTTRLLKKVETEVLPGAGDDDHVGRVEKMDDTMSAASGDAASGTWQVGGRTFVVNDATAIDSSLAQSSLAVVNSYKAADGTQVATRIDAVNVNSLLFLPSLSNR